MKSRPREKQSIIPKPPFDHNGSKVVDGNHKPIFKKAKDLVK